MKDEYAAVTVVEADGWHIGYAEEGVAGYTPTTYGPYAEQRDADTVRDAINETLGITPARRLQIHSSSMAAQNRRN